MDKPQYHNLIRFTGHPSTIAKLHHIFADPSAVLNSNALFKPPESIAQGDWEKLGRHWQKTNWGFEGYPDVYRNLIDADPEEPASFMEVHIITTLGDARPLMEKVAKDHPASSFRWCTVWQRHTAKPLRQAAFISVKHQRSGTYTDVMPILK